MTFNYLNSYKDNLKEYGPTLMAITDSASSFGDGTNNHNAQKLTHSNGVVSFGAGSGITIQEQNSRIRELNGKISNEYVVNELFPNLCTFHNKSTGLPDLTDPELNINELDQEVLQKIQKNSTKTYIGFKGEKGYNVFKLNFGQINNETQEVQRPNFEIFQDDVKLYDGSGIQTLIDYENVRKWMNPGQEFIGSTEKDLNNRILTYRTILGAIGEANFASKSPGVNDYLQIGVFNNKGYHTLLHRDVILNDNEEALNYTNSALSINIPEKNSNTIEDILEGEKISKEISDKFFANIKNLNKSQDRIDMLGYQINTGAIKKTKIDEFIKLLDNIKNKSFIPNRDEVYQNIKNFIDGEQYKMIDQSSKEGKKIKRLQKRYPKSN